MWDDVFYLEGLQRNDSNDDGSTHQWLSWVEEDYKGATYASKFESQS